MPPSVAPLEVVWTGIAVLGGAVATALLAAIWQSYRAVADWIEHGRLVRWGPRHRFVVGFMAGVGLLVLVWGGFLALGINALGNLPPTTPDRSAASERGGWILVCLEAVLFAFQAILLYAWVAVGRPTLNPDRAPRSPVALLFRTIDLARNMGHIVAGDLQRATTFCEAVATDPAMTESVRSEAALSLADIKQAVRQVGELHRLVKEMEEQA